MATSSIFANVHITTPEAAKKFVHALELSEKDPPIPHPKNTIFMTDHDEIMRWLGEKFDKEQKK